ncbi:LRRN4 C-terminal-like protein [Bombina bombina]|uniref:LRRN4 C-terminal-like protein n=1 Tax=Bombina bombina TaxID=8345 RepID=UPI00235A5402|nr:LRRN4 C-terminal-like protein [Bombina bombina]
MSLLLPLLLVVIPFSLMTSAAPTPLPDDKNSTQPWTNTTEMRDNKSVPVTTFSPTSDNNQTMSESSLPSGPRDTPIHRTTPERIQFITGGDVADYYEDEDEDDSEERPVTSFPPKSVSPCNYNRCKHLELPCEEIQRMQGGNCLCPGVDGAGVPPDAPGLGELLPGEMGASVRWCSPLSTVRGYKVLYGPLEGPMETGPVLNASYRAFTIERLSPNTPYRVCVVAFNEAGESPIEGGEEEEEEAWEGGKPHPCRVLRTTGSQVQQVYLGVGVGLAALAALLGLIGLGWWFCGRRKSKTIKETEGKDMGVTNLSYKAESVEQL